MLFNIAILFILAQEEQKVFVQINEWLKYLLVMLLFEEDSLALEDNNFAELVNCFKVKTHLMLV